MKTMNSIKEIFRIGAGPSSSHTMGPQRAAKIFLERNPRSASFKVSLFGSLAATGKGHLTDKAILEVLEPHAPVQIEWLPKIFLPFHPNAMTFCAINSENEVLDTWTVYSIGGGALSEENRPPIGEISDVYDMSHLSDILRWCEHSGRSYWEYVEEREGVDIWEYLSEVWKNMKECIQRGLDTEGVLPGPLNLRRKAADYFIQAGGYKEALKDRYNRR